MTRSSMSGALEFPFTDSSYDACHFHFPKSVTFPASATGTDCVFDHGHSGGTFT
jgi:hypothetical protein